ncbi:hypothetical protein [Clostridium aminobutyricum]|uniref:Uncharacterized protein n=1 Tax=Clostridium aminobutyricum TaxID=33953 RepID=A0A939DAS2_CLOAM|nr:hypothetical protein [Clostridium aminobutyricum]MBN7774260.1 hypothetical protein [Clostridium aminobutyricum]
MKTTKSIVCVGLIFVLAVAMLLPGCAKSNKSGQTEDEPQITVDYLEGDYVEQLVRDGAEHVFGTIELNQADDGTIQVNIAEKVLVEDSSQPEGYYIEDKNSNLSAVLGTGARATFLNGNVSLPQIMSSKEFVKAYQDNLTKNSGKNDSKLYDIYIMGDQIELILAKYINK